MLNDLVTVLLAFKESRFSGMVDVLLGSEFIILLCSFDFNYMLDWTLKLWNWKCLLLPISYLLFWESASFEGLVFNYWESLVFVERTAELVRASWFRIWPLEVVTCSLTFLFPGLRCEFCRRLPKCTSFPYTFDVTFIMTTILWWKRMKRLFLSFLWQNIYFIFSLHFYSSYYMNL